jgi:hypothetical protein
MGSSNIRLSLNPLKRPSGMSLSMLKVPIENVQILVGHSQLQEFVDFAFEEMDIRLNRPRRSGS